MKISIITPTSQVIGWNNPADVGISRIGVNTIGFGNGTAADITGIMQGGTLALGGATIGANALAVTGTSSFSGTIGVVTATSLALGGATIGANAIAVTGSGTISGVFGTTAVGSVSAPSIFVGNTNTGFYNLNTNSSIAIAVNGVDKADFANTSAGWWLAGGVVTTGGYTAANTGVISWSGRTAITSGADGSLTISNNGGTASEQLSIPASNTWQYGAADAAVAVAQTTRVQSVVAGTAAAAGADWTHIGSLGTGTGTPGKMTFQVGVAQASGTAQSTATTALQLVGAANGSLPTVLMPGFANTATTSAVCYNTSTGLLTYDGTIGTCNTSTMRVKHDIVPLSSENMLTGVLQMQPNSFFYNDDQNTPGQQLGLMAEDLEVIDPRLIAYDDEGKPSSIRYLGPMFSYLIGAIQAQQVEIEALRKKH